MRAGDRVSSTRVSTPSDSPQSPSPNWDLGTSRWTAKPLVRQNARSLLLAPVTLGKSLSLALVSPSFLWAPDEPRGPDALRRGRRPRGRRTVGAGWRAHRP